MATLQMTTGVNQYNVSGTAREWDNQQLFQTISELGQGLQEAEKSIMYVFSKYMNEDMKEFSVVYNNQYGIIDAATTLANATSALTMNISEEYNEEMRKQVVRATLKDVDANIVDKLVESVENSPTGKQPLEPGQVSVVQPTGM